MTNTKYGVFVKYNTPYLVFYKNNVRTNLID